MTFVIYDIETTGLTKGFDQIVQFAAVRADAELNVIEQFHIRCRLMPHVFPSPGAMRVTGLSIEQLTHPALPSHYEMITAIHQKLQSWCPALFLGFNSLSFDEEFLRQGFYQSLHNAYLTNTQRSGRADVLNLCRMTAALRADILKPATDQSGRQFFKLKLLAEANGIAVSSPHDAMADVGTTLTLCRHIRAGAPEIWSQFLRFSQKASVESFITDEDAFLVSETFGNQHRSRVVTHIGRHAEQATRHYCLDLRANLAMLKGLSQVDLIELCRSKERPIVTVRTNAAPTLWALYDASPEHLIPFADESEVLERVSQLREDRSLMDRLTNAARAAERTYPPSPHVEDQLYGYAFPSAQDEELMKRFHIVPWEHRPNLVSQLSDERYRRLALRLIYLERADLLGNILRQTIEKEFRARMLTPADAEVRWRSIPATQREIQELIAAGINGEALSIQLRYIAYLRERAAVVAA